MTTASASVQLRVALVMLVATSSGLYEKLTSAQCAVVVTGEATVVDGGRVAAVAGAPLDGGVPAAPADVVWSLPLPHPARVRTVTTARTDAGEKIFRRMSVPP